MCGEGMSRPGKRSMRSVSIQGKLEAIRRVHEGESKASVARDLGVPESTLRGWCKNETKINQLSRQSSSPDAVADVGEPPKSKRARVSEDAAAAAAAAAVVAAAPFNLSLRTGGGRYSPNNDTVATARRASPPNTTPPGRSQNGRTAEATITAAAAKLPSSSTDTDAGRAVARSMDAIARMAAEAAVAQANSLQTAAAGSYQAELLHQWTLLQRMMRTNQQPSTVQQHSKKSAPLKIDINSSTGLPSTSTSTPGDSLLTTVVRPSEKHAASKSSSSAADESLALWLQTQQAALGAVQSYPHANGVDKKHSVASSSLPSTITSTGGMFPIPSTSANGAKYSNTTLTNMMSDALLNWYKYATLAPLQQAMAPAVHTMTPAVPTTVAAAAAAAVPATITAAVPASPAVPAVVAAEPNTTAERPILYKHLTKKPKRRLIQKEVPAAAAVPSSYPVCEQEFAEDLSTGRGRNSESGDSRLSNASPMSSSMSIPSPAERPLSVNPPADEEPSSPASSSSSSTRMLVPPSSASPAAQKETTAAIFAGQSAAALTTTPTTAGCSSSSNNNNGASVVVQQQQKGGNNGQLPNGKATKPKKQINALLAQFESHHEAARDVEEGGRAGGEEPPPPADWREAVAHGERFLRWLESGMETAVTHFQVNQFKTIIAKVKANGELKERR